jgi:hypothetical protein
VLEGKLKLLNIFNLFNYLSVPPVLWENIPAYLSG